MASKRYDEMTREELDAWYERHQRSRGVRAVFILLIVFTIAWAAWFSLRVWREHSEAHFRAEEQRQIEELRGIEVQENATSPCTLRDSADCNPQTDTVPAHTVNASTPAVQVSR